MKCTILFDLDGTLIDSTEAILESFHKAFRFFGKEPPEDKQILTLIGHPLDFMFRHLGIKENVEEYVTRYKVEYRKIFKEKTKLLPTAREALKEAATFAKLGVVTTKTGKYSRELLEYMGLMSYFGVLVGSEDVLHHKPHPEPILKAMHHLESDLQNSFMVGDTCLDMEAAHAANITGIGVSCGYGSKEHMQKCSRHLFATPLEGVAFIKRVCQLV